MQKRASKYKPEALLRPFCQNEITIMQIFGVVRPQVTRLLPKRNHNDANIWRGPTPGNTAFAKTKSQ
jgi:hypothetical protein